MDKAKIRKKMIRARLDLDSETYTSKSNFIVSKLKQNIDFITAKTIGIYVSFNNEVYTLDLINEMLKNKRVCVPKTKQTVMEFYEISSLQELKKGNYGILEPNNNQLVSKQEIDLLIVPLVAYDSKNNRLGYGGGFYDRYLKNYHGKVIGLAFNLQKVDYLPIESFDLPLETIIDEK